MSSTSWSRIMATKWDSGHSNPVLSLAISKERVIASGAESGELTFWSEQGTPLGKLHLKGDEDVTGVTFSPVSFSRLYAAHGETVSVLDIRALGDPVETFSINKEEINCISVNETDSLLAAADDSGTVKVLDLQSKKVCRTLQRHTNICSAVVFRPHRPQSLVSCGLDMQVLLWNVQKARPLWLTNLQHLAQDEEDLDLHQSPGQLFNPPLAHSLSVSSCGNVFCCGAEDGKIRSFRITGTRFEEDLCFKAHTQGVSQVSFIGQDSGQTLLLSGGNDGRVCLWNLRKDAVQAQKPQKHHPKKSSSKLKVKQMAEASPRVSSSLCIEHGEKVNWILGAELQGSKVVLVADPSNAISVYQLGEL
ncbi:WD repeat-containing protein 53 isoform X2 [Bufo bufo]|uniref:WD repeat-containing protein 53 isoform X2 n=1 Tax=Bufo bufo TaxID=8384 RepID=UPI001ABDA2E5|nr:WD repeat-containing protein 53 isoform X2 [Bufo bufo]